MFQRAPDGEELVFDEEVIERVREGGEVEIRRTTRRNRRIHDELPLVAEKYKEFRATRRGDIMSRKFQCRAIPSTWLEKKVVDLIAVHICQEPWRPRDIRRLACRKEHLELTKGGIRWHISVGKTITRYGLIDDDHGIPFLRSTDILEADLSFSPFISKKQVDCRIQLLMKAVDLNNSLRNDRSHGLCSIDMDRTVPCRKMS